MRERKISVRRRRYLENICTLVLQFFLYHSIACTVIGLFYETERPENYIAFIFFSVPLLYLAFIRKYIKNFFLCLILHLPVFCSVLFAGHDFAQKTVICVCTVIMTVISLHMRTMAKGSIKECPSMKLCLVLLVCYIFSLSTGHPICAQYIYYEILAFIIVRFVYDSLSNMSGFLRMNQDKANFPAGQIVIVNQMSMLIFLGALTGGMLLFPKLHMELALLPLLELAGMFLNWIVSLIHLPETDASSGSEAQRTDMTALVRSLREESQYETMWEVVEEFLQAALIVVIVAAAIAGILYLFYRLYKGYYMTQKDNEDEKEFLIGELRWTRERSVSVEEREKQRQGNRNWKIRREYRRYVKSNFGKKEKIPEALTPQEMLLFLQEKNQRDFKDDMQQEKIREIYERARYGQAECSQAELYEIKMLMRSK